MKGILAILMAGIMMAAMVAPAMSQDAQTSADVGNAAPDVAITSISPDPADPGDTVTVSGTLTDPNGIDDVTSLTYDVKYPNGTTYESGSITSIVSPWSFNFALPTGCNAPPGTWTVNVTANDGTISDTDSSTFVVNDLVAITVTNMNYGSVTAGTNNNPGNHTVTNDGNVAIVFDEKTTSGYNNDTGDGITWTDMADNGNTITADNIRTDWTASTSIAACASAVVDFKLDVPTGTSSGTYTGTTTFTPTKV